MRYDASQHEMKFAVRIIYDLLQVDKAHSGIAIQGNFV